MIGTQSYNANQGILNQAELARQQQINEKMNYANTAGQNPQLRSIEQITEAMQNLLNRESQIRMRICDLAGRLGYNQPDSSSKTAPSPVPNGCLETIADKMRQLGNLQDETDQYLTQVERHI